MAYITTSDLSARLGTTLYGRLTDRVDGATASDTTGQEIVDEAEALANSHLSRRYRTPIDLSVHPELSAVMRARVLDLAEVIAWRTSPFTAGIPDRLTSLHEEALAWFSGLGRGEIHLPGAAPPASTTAVADEPRFRATPRTLTHEELEGL